MPFGNDVWMWAAKGSEGQRMIFSKKERLCAKVTLRDFCNPQSRRCLSYANTINSHLPFFVLIFRRWGHTEKIQLHLAHLSKKKLNQQHNIKYLVCEEEAKYFQKVQRY